MLSGIKMAIVLSGVIGLLIGVWQVRSCQIDRLKAQKEVAEKTAEVEKAKEKAREKVDDMEPRDILDYWKRMHQ